MKSPDKEFTYIADELEKCGVPVKHRLNPTDISTFIDVRLQHGKTTLKDDPCKSATNGYKDLKMPSTWENPTMSDQKLYVQVIGLYCDMESRVAFKAGYRFDESIKNL